MQPVSNREGTTASIAILGHKLFSPDFKSRFSVGPPPNLFRATTGLPQVSSRKSQTLSRLCGREDCGPLHKLLLRPRGPLRTVASQPSPHLQFQASTSSSLLSPQRSDFRVGGETWARAPRPLSPIWVIASRAQPLGRLLVEPADVMGHRLPVRGVGLLLPPLSAPAAAVGTGSQPILKPCGEEPVTPVLASSQGPKDPLPGRPGSSPHHHTSFETGPSHLLCPGPSRMCVGGGTPPPPGICGDGAPLELEGFPSPNSPSFPTPSRCRGLG